MIDKSNLENAGPVWIARCTKEKEGIDNRYIPDSSKWPDYMRALNVTEIDINWYAQI